MAGARTQHGVHADSRNTFGGLGERIATVRTARFLEWWVEGVGVRLLNERLIRGSSKVLRPAHGRGRSGARRHARRGRRGVRAPPRATPTPPAARPRARVSQVSPWCLPRGRSHAHERGSDAQRARAVPALKRGSSSRSMRTQTHTAAKVAQAFLPLTAGGQVPLAAGSGLQYSSIASVSIEKLTQWKPVQTMQKSLRMNLST